MSGESKSGERSFEFPMMPIYGVDLGERLGSLAEGQKQLRGDFQRLETRIDVLDAKIETVDSRVDKCLVAVNRLSERTRNLSLVTWSGIVVLLIAIIAQKLL